MMGRHGMIVKIVMDWIMKPPFPTFGTSKSFKFLVGIHENFMNVKWDYHFFVGISSEDLKLGRFPEFKGAVGHGRPPKWIQIAIKS